MTKLNLLTNSEKHSISSTKLQLEKIVKKYQDKIRLEYFTRLLATLIFLVYLIGINEKLYSTITGLVITAIAFGLVLFISWLLSYFEQSEISNTLSLLPRKVTATDLLAHCERNFVGLEESAQLVLIDDEKLSFLALLQKDKIQQRLHTLLVTKQPEILGRFQAKMHLSFAAIVTVALLFLPVSDIEQMLIDNNATSKHSDVKINMANPIVLEQAKVTITPAVYSGLPSQVTEQLDLKLFSGSKVRWELNFSDVDQAYFLQLANGKQIDFMREAGNSFGAEYIVEHTGLYQIVSADKRFSQLHTMNVVQDQKAKIRFISPKATVTEIATLAQPILKAEVDISDDFGIEKVEILASIAKGSGESVKFRDQLFSFDKLEQVKRNSKYVKSARYIKTWQLSELGMEAGDELYFTVKVWDNKQPTAQLTSSVTKIIRWLEDEQQLVLSDGILIDFMPEYFKSQRQIIIETQELITDQEQLSIDQFNDTSRSLGFSQNELKQKYGQYLGDEFSQGGIDNAEHADSDIEGEHDEAEMHEKEAQNAAEAGHEHQPAEESVSNELGDKSGYLQVIEKYAHNHEDSDIGVMGRQDPKALMKRSIANMWQAELHLMLSQPMLALPFEQQALKFLKMAKKAERIYVKRLGFEPPPVSEQRRYQGELEDILSYQQIQPLNLSVSDNKKLSQLFSLLNKSNTLKKVIVLDEEQLLLIQEVKQLLQTKAEQRPSLIAFVATLERIQLAKSLLLKKCQQCLEQESSLDNMQQLKDKLWQLLTLPIAAPVLEKKPYLNSNSLMQRYINAISGEVSGPDSKQGNTEKPTTIVQGEDKR